jgi:hypothetical protein
VSSSASASDILVRVKGRLFVGVASMLAASFASVPPARADATQEQCINAYEKNQTLSLDGKFRAAREQLLVCSRPSCPKITQGDCGKWLAALEPRIPSVIVTAKSASGTDLESVRVLMDGEVLAERLDGRPVAVDPGPHTFRFESGEQILEERVVVVEGEKLRRLVADYGKLAPKVVEPPPPPPAPSSAGIPTVSWVLGGVTVLSLASFVGFAAAGKSAESCVPTCARSEIDSFRRDYLIADISLGVALVSAGAAVYFALTNKASGSTSAGATGLARSDAPLSRPQFVHFF